MRISDWSSDVCSSDLRDVMGATQIHEPFDLPEQGVKVCFVDTPTDSGLNGTQIELVEPLPGNTSIAGFLEKHPAGGQHHMCYEVPDIHAAKAAFEAMGKPVPGNKGRASCREEGC